MNQDNHSFDPDAIFRLLENAAEEMADTLADAARLEELKKPRLAMITLEFMRKKISRVEAETRALADPEYAEYIEGLVDAKRKHTRAIAKYADLKILAGHRQTEESSRRALTR